MLAEANIFRNSFHEQFKEITNIDCSSGCPNSSLLYFEHFDCNCNRHQYLRAIILHQTLLEIKNFGSSLRYAETNHERVFFSCMLPKQK